MKKNSGSAFQPASAPDYLPRPVLRELQLTRLQAIVKRAYERVPLFQLRMEERRVGPEQMAALEDIAKLPFTTKADLRDTYPFGMFASPMQDVVRLHASSGTTGKPIVVAYTQADVDVWTSVMVRSFAVVGLHQGDVVQNAYGYGLFTGGLGAHYGAEGLGATVIPDFGRQHGPADHGDEGFRGDGDLFDTKLFSAHDRAGGGDGRRYPGIAATRRRVRRGAVVGFDEEAD